MHEVLFDDRWLKDTGVTTLDFAKAMIDEGFHPMTMYFPLVVHGAMLIEPTEVRSRRPRSIFSSRRCAISAMRALARRRRERFTPRRFYAPRRRLDETLAARKPVLRRTQGAA